MVVQVVSCSKYVANAHLSSHARDVPPFLVSLSMRPFFSYTVSTFQMVLAIVPVESSNMVCGMI